jgi:peptide chain release factor subunit 1
MADTDDLPYVLVLTPMKDSARFLPRYAELLERLDWPRERLSIGILEGDSRDGTADALARLRPRLERRARRLTLVSRDFGFRMPAGVPRWAPAFQLARRTVLARARNHVLFRALDDEDWVLWIDADLADYPADVLRRLIGSGHDLVMPRCVVTPGGRAFDANAWGAKGAVDFNHTGGQSRIRLDSMGGTMLLVKADLHRDGLVFPCFRYGVESPRIRDRHPVWGKGEVETEGLGIMATDMGVQGWGLCDLEIVHGAD